MKNSKILGRNNHLTILFIIFFSLIICLILVSILWYRNPTAILTKDSSKMSPSEISTDNSQKYPIPITPNVVESSRQGWNTFTHPHGDFSLEYPSSWNLYIEKNSSNVVPYDYLFTNTNTEKDSFRINAMYEGRGAPNFDYEKNYIKYLGKNKTNWNVMYSNDIPFEAVVSFPDAKPGELIGFYIYLPKTNQEEFFKTLEQVVASIK